MRRLGVGLLLFLFAEPRPALAGMPSFTLTEVAALRISALSFFVVAFFVLSFAIQKLWNALARDFPQLPEVTYKKAVQGTLLVGLLFHLVLTMISGAREIMTPGAWERSGLTHALKLPVSPQEQLDAARQFRIEEVKNVLWSFASKHDGRLPVHELTGEVPESTFLSLHPSGERFIYLSGKLGPPRRPLLYEPSAYGSSRFVLYSDGSIEKRSPVQILQEVRDGP